MHGIAATTVYLMGFFATVPMTVFESGLIDGCSHITSFYRLILPLAKPGIVTITIFNFIGYWNEYIWALVFSGKQANRTLAVALQTLVTSMQTTGNYQGLFAGVVIVFVPTVIIYVLLSKQIMSGATAGRSQRMRNDAQAGTCRASAQRERALYAVLFSP